MPAANTPEKFWALYRPDETTGCLLWTGDTNPKGYGRVKFRGFWLAHRLAWTLRHGPIPEGVDVLHSCDNPPCGLDEHLFLGTNGDNNRDRHGKGRSRGPKGELNGNAKLTEATVAAIKQRRREGAKLREIASELGVGRANVGNILCGLTWKHVS